MPSENKKSVAKTATAQKKKTQSGAMSSSDIRECKAELLRKRSLIVGNLSKMESAALRASEQDSSVDHMADFGSDNYEQEFTLGLIENVEGLCQEIDDALERIQEGIYGACEVCGCKIPKARLKAIPWARNCVNCQSEMEKSL